ncbi:MAG: DEAD/DEAH box helicase [Balneolia bacterium]|nr:DEAD/DEAH box helicase [Balneolia bacterium]
MLFKEFDLCEEVLDGIRDMGFEEATEIQQKAIPIALAGKNLLGTSFTGSGKTAAFVLPIIHHIFKSKKEGIQALVLAPTRELAQQIDEQFWSLGYHAGISSVCVYGGSNWSDQEKAMKAGVNVVVATPGRLLDQMKITTYDFNNIDYLVLDEADRMLDMGFLPDVRSIINRIPNERQSLLFSATVTPRIESLAKEFTNGTFERVKVGRIAPAKGIHQVYYKVGDSDKKDLLLQLYKEQQWHSAIVFASTKRGVDILARSLGKMGVAVDSIHGDRDQKEREFTLDKFRSGKIKVLVATDVMARGIDVDDISHIINYDVPNDVDDYIHRIGRTARAKSTGNAITFVSRRDWKQMLEIIDSKGLDIKEEPVPEEIASKSTGDDSSDAGNRSSRGRNNQSRGRGGNGRNNRGGSGRNNDNKPASRNTKSDSDSKDSDGSVDQKGKEQESKSDAQKSDNQKDSGSDEQKNDDQNRRRRPKRRPRGGSNRGGRNKGNKADQNTDSTSSDKKGDDTSDENKSKQRRSHNRRRPQRRSGGNKSQNNGGGDGAQNDNQGDNKGNKSSRRRSPRGRGSSGGNKGGSNDRNNQDKSSKPAGDKQKHIRNQEKLIEQVQQSRIPDTDTSSPKGKKESGKAKKGIWGKLKNLFD